MRSETAGPFVADALSFAGVILWSDIALRELNP
jgi:hypothetical protein